MSGNASDPSPGNGPTTIISGFQTLIQFIGNIQQTLAAIVVALKNIASSL
jgi:hypothetical protein